MTIDWVLHSEYVYHKSCIELKLNSKTFVYRFKNSPFIYNCCFACGTYFPEHIKIQLKLLDIELREGHPF